MNLAAEYAMIGRLLSERFDNTHERLDLVGRMRRLHRIEDGAVGFLKARTASFLKSMVLNCQQVPPDKTGEFCKLLHDTANFLLILPDAPGGNAPDRGPARTARFASDKKPALPAARVAWPVPERD